MLAFAGWTFTLELSKLCCLNIWFRVIVTMLSEHFWVIFAQTNKKNLHLPCRSCKRSLQYHVGLPVHLRWASLSIGKSAWVTSPFINSQWEVESLFVCVHFFSMHIHTCKKAPKLINPPLEAYHEHAGDGQLHVGAPLLQWFHWPACRGGDKPTYAAWDKMAIGHKTDGEKKIQKHSNIKSPPHVATCSFFQRMKAYRKMQL